MTTTAAITGARRGGRGHLRSRATSYRDILEFFFQIHRPDLGEGLAGSDYRSEIFYTSDEQRQIAEDTIAAAAASGIWSFTLARSSRLNGCGMPLPPEDEV